MLSVGSTHTRVHIRVCVCVCWGAREQPVLQQGLKKQMLRESRHPFGCLLGQTHAQRWWRCPSSAVSLAGDSSPPRLGMARGGLEGQDTALRVPRACLQGADLPGVAAPHPSERSCMLK